jgi:serine/threonine protein kinase
MLQEGEVLRSRYQIQRQLGQNAGRRTLLAQDLQTQELIVLKILSFNSHFQWEDLKLFEREAETLQSLSHPAIPCYLDFFELDLPNYQGFVLVQTYINATSLQEWIKQGRTFSEAEVKQIAKALLNVLSYLHDRNPPVIHRDLKPSNILLTGDRSAHQVGDVYLVDFGSVQTAVRESGTLTIVGTYGYMPPEQFSGRAFPASDLYSLGATLIYLITGAHPADLLQEDLLLQFEPTKDLPPSFVQWLKLLTSPNRKQRFTSAKSALQALEQPLLHTQTIELSATAAPITLQKPEGSKVSLQKSAESLKICLPPENSTKVSGWSLSWSVGLVLSVVIALLTSLLGGNVAVAILCVWLLWATITGLREAFWTTEVETHISIDPRAMIVTQKFWGKQRQVFQASRYNLYKLTYVKRFYLRDKDGNIDELSPELGIWAKQSGDSTYYRIGRSLSASTEAQLYGYLTTAELDWLAQELSSWLGLPITRQ